MKKQKTFLRGQRQSEEMILQITSMADIFIIILVFLLKSYSTSLTTISPTGSIVLPTAPAESSVQETVKVEVTSEAVLIEQKPIVPLKNFEFTDAAPVETAISNEVYKALMDQRQIQGTTEMGSSLVLLADEKMPNSTFQRILASAANAGFIDLQLIVVKQE